MNVYRIIAIGEAREIYDIEAESESEARELFESGAITVPALTEVSGSEIDSIEEIDS